MAEESWHAARLIPTSGINGAEEQERRATSALLAVLSVVKEFAKTLLSPVGAPSGVVDTFIEVPFLLGEHRHYPDGLIRVTRGQRSWTALVEVKTGSNKLDAPQLEAYLDIAREQGFNALLTISNEIAAIAGTHPTPLDRRKVKRVPVHHLSWTQVLTAAVMQKVHRGVSDPEQAWILGELIRYLEHPRSGAMEFEDMGPSWVSVREAVSHGTLRATDKGVTEVANRWDQLMRYTCLVMGRRLGVEVQPVLSRKELSDPAVRAQALSTSLAARGVLDGSVRVPGAAGPLSVCADLRTGRVSVWIDIDAPKAGRPQTRVNWLLRQLKDAPEGVRLDAFALHARGVTTSQLLREARRDPSLMVEDPKRELRSFRLTISGPMGSKRGQGRGSFVSSVLELVDLFYRDVVQGLRPWAAAPPKLRSAEEAHVHAVSDDVAASLTSTALSSQDGATATVGPDEFPVPEVPAVPQPAEAHGMTVNDVGLRVAATVDEP